jgi:hypothetical protein
MLKTFTLLFSRARPPLPAGASRGGRGDEAGDAVRSKQVDKGCVRECAHLKQKLNQQIKREKKKGEAFLVHARARLEEAKEKKNRIKTTGSAHACTTLKGVHDVTHACIASPQGRFERVNASECSRAFFFYKEGRRHAARSHCRTDGRSAWPLMHHRLRHHATRRPATSSVRTKAKATSPVDKVISYLFSAGRLLNLHKQTNANRHCVSCTVVPME